MNTDKKSREQRVEIERGWTWMGKAKVESRNQESKAGTWGQKNGDREQRGENRKRKAESGNLTTDERGFTRMGIGTKKRKA